MSLSLMGALFVSSLGVALTPANTSAITVFSQCSSNKDSAVCRAQGTDNFSSLMKTVVNTMLFILGAIAVIMIVIGGIRYTISNGEAANIKAAKDTILYAVVGLLVAILAYAIVNFVITSFK